MYFTVPLTRRVVDVRTLFISANAVHRQSGRYPRRDAETTDSTLTCIGGSIMFLPPHMEEKPHSRPQEMLFIFHLMENRMVPDVSARTLESAFFTWFSLTELATTESAKVTLDNELTSHEELFPLRARGAAWAQT